MNDLLIDFLRGFTNSNDWSALLPEVLLALLALVILVADIVLPKGKCNSIEESKSNASRSKVLIIFW